MKEANVNNLSINPVTIKSTTLNLNEIEVIIKEFYPDSSGSKLTKTLLKFGDQKFLFLVHLILQPKTQQLIMKLYSKPLNTFLKTLTMQNQIQ